MEAMGKEEDFLHEVPGLMLSKRYELHFEVPLVVYAYQSKRLCLQAFVHLYCYHPWRPLRGLGVAYVNKR